MTWYVVQREGELQVRSKAVKLLRQAEALGHGASIKVQKQLQARTSRRFEVTRQIHICEMSR